MLSAYLLYQGCWSQGGLADFDRSVNSSQPGQVMSTTLILAPLLAVAERTSYLRTYYDILIKKSKVENIFKGSLDLIPSTSPLMKIQIMGRKVCLRYKGKTLHPAKICLYTSSIFSCPSFKFSPKMKLIQSRLPFKIFYTLPSIIFCRVG